MLTQTSELAMKALIYLGTVREERPIPPYEMAEHFECSPTYLGKTLGMLARAGILNSRRGARGGFFLERDPETISLQSIVEACQGILVGDYCQFLGERSNRRACAFHQAMEEVHTAIVGVLSEWTLADLLARPHPNDTKNDAVCKVAIKGLRKRTAGRRRRG